MNIQDIQGTRARPHTFQRNLSQVHSYNAMDYRDVTDVDFHSSRHINPMEPTYLVRDETKNMEVITIGPVEGSKPCVLPPARQDLNFVAKSLKTEDILGCSIGTKNHGNFHTRDRRGYKITNVTSDVIGA